jgi:hypothetical protein
VSPTDGDGYHPACLVCQLCRRPTTSFVGVPSQPKLLVGLYKLNPVVTRSLKAPPGFSTLEVKTWFQGLPFKCNSYRYILCCQLCHDDKFAEKCG